MKKHLVSIADLTQADVRKIFALARQVKRSPKKYQNRLKGRMFGLIFEKPSTRTWISFEAGIFSLGGGVIFLGPEDMKLGVREEIRDVARVLNRYLSGVVLRTFSHVTITEFGKYFEGVIVNGLSDFEHPCQALTDFFTVAEKFPHGVGARSPRPSHKGGETPPLLAFVGDGNNVLNSLILLTALTGGRLNYATPKGREPDSGILERAKKLSASSGALLRGSHDPAEAVKGADVVYTDVWVSMGEESLRETKLKDFAGMQINRALMKHAKPSALVMHCLPAHRSEEITDEVLESRHSVIFDQAENRLHVQKALLLHLLGRNL